MMMASPMITDPYRMASEVFWSSSISLRTENGESLTITKKASAKTTMPKTPIRTLFSIPLKSS